MSDRLERSLQQIDRDGAVVLRDQADRLRLEADALARLKIAQLSVGRDTVIRDRLEQFHDLMNKGRAQQAFIQSQALREDLTRQGQAKLMPQAVVSGERNYLANYHLKELKDLVRLREERFLATLLEVEKSHVPFPDEPPVEFPNAAKIRFMTRGQFDNWADLSKYRAERYSSSGFGPEMPKRGAGTEGQAHGSQEVRGLR